MSVELKLVFASVQEAANALAKLGAPTTAAPAAAKPETAATPAKDTPKTKESAGSPASSSAAAAASPASAEPKAAAAEKPADTPTYEKSGLPEKIKAAVGKDKAGVVALLKEFGVAKGPELKPEQFAAFGEKIDALLGAGDLA